MNRLTALAAVALLWAAIYLPGLGSPELKGEEPRRALPAIAMLDTGNWLVPQLSGHPYLSKPPLVNWLIAISMEVTGNRDEWSARLPSVLAMLALALTMVWTGSRWLTPAGGFTAAAFVLASVAFVEKGRLAEIEADYVALTGIAFAWWLAAWVKRETGWRLWLVPGLFLGLGLLAKGPTHLLLFYAVVIPVLIATREWRQFWSLAHLAALALALLLFVAWWVPYHRATTGLGAEGVWLAQMEGRVGGGSFHLKDWLPNLPRALCNGLPWLLFAPLWWDRRVLAALGEKEERARVLVVAARWPLVVAYAGLMLIPGMLPRYTLPLFPAIALLLALVAPHAPLRWWKVWWWTNAVLLGIVLVGAVISPWIKPPAFVLNAWALLPLAVLLLAISRRLDRPGGQPPAASTPTEETAILTSWTAWIVAGGMAVYTVTVLPRMHLREVLRPIGTGVNAAVPPGDSLYIVGREYEPSFFYIQRSCVFLDSVAGLPAGARYLLLQNEQWENSQGQLPETLAVTHLRSRSKKEFYILKIENQNAPKNKGG